jgi:pyrimidine operon attenuation protein / uracil phosphoribosyltransferase
MLENKDIISAGDMKKLTHQIAQSIIKNHADANSIALIGIYNRGVSLAQRLQKEIETLAKAKVDFGTLDITLYRDDLDTVGHKPIVKATRVAFDLTDKNVILVDDVLFTGRTIRAALNALVDLGRARSIQLAVLVDRGHRELPIQADYIGKKLSTSRSEIVKVRLMETDGVDEVILLKSAGKSRK